MEQEFTPRTFYDFVSGFPDGVNSGISPVLLQKSQLGMAVNASLRGGYAKTRPPVVKKPLIFSDPLTATTFQTGLFQGGGYYRPDFGTESLICQISGHLFKLTESGASWLVSDISVPGDLNSATVNQIWMWQSEKWMIVNDGTGALPIFFDGTTSRRSFGPSQLWGTTSVAFTPPAIGATVTLTLVDPYAGQYDVPVILNGEFYQPIRGTLPGQYPVSIKNVSAIPGGDKASGDSVTVRPDLVGVASVTTEVQFGVGIYVVLHFSPLIPDPVQAGTTKTFNIVTSANIPVALTGSDWQDFIDVVTGVRVVKHLFPKSITDVTGPGQPYNSVVSVQTTSPSVTLGTLSTDFIVPAVGASANANLSQPYSGSSNQPIWIDGEQFLISSAPISPSTTSLTVINLTDASVAVVNPPAEILSVPELPAGRMGAYGMARNWFSLIDGISYEAGDIVGGASGTPANNYRDSVLKTTENDFLTGGGSFRLPGTGDIITAMIFPPIMDTSLGQGQLQIFTAFSAFSNNSPVDRAEWAALTSPLQTESLKDNGALAQNSTILLNSDAFFRSPVGIGSLLLARRDFANNSWGNKPISNELQRILDKDIQSLLSYGSAITFDNRFISTCAPNVSANGVFHIGLVTLNNDLLSSLRVTVPPAWEGAWSGINCLQVVSGRVNGGLRAFAFTFNINENRIELYEFLSEQSAKTSGIYKDNNQTDIKWFFETPVLFNKDVKPQTTLCQLRNGEVYISKILGNVHVKVLYKPDFYPCWTKWNEFDVCESNAGTNPQAGYRMRVGLGEPDSTPVEIGNDRPLRNGYFFQFRVEITGSCTVNGIRVSSTEIPIPVFAPIEQDGEPCQNIDCEVPNDLETYSLQGLPPQPLPPITPSRWAFFNNAVYFEYCADGTIELSGSQPSWLNIDNVNHRLGVNSGVFGGATQAGADASASRSLNEFVANNLNSGSLSCNTTDVIILKDQEVTSVLDAFCQNMELVGGKLFFMPSFTTKIFGSSDGLSWSNLQTAPTQQYDIAYGLGLYITCGAISGTNRYYTSPDAVAWTARAFNFSGSPTRCICFGAGIFVVGAANGHFWHGTDGINWTDGGRVDPASGSEIYRIKFLNGKFWAISSTGGKVYSSPDGLTWSTAGSFAAPKDITYGSGVYAVASNGFVSTSPNGTVWTAHTFPGSILCTCIAFRSGSFVAGGGDHLTKSIFQSTDCINWTAWGVVPNQAPASAVNFSGGTFIVAEG